MTGPPRKKRGPRGACNIATGNDSDPRSPNGSPAAPAEQGSRKPERQFPATPPAVRWSLAELISECRSAPSVFLALLEVCAENGSVQIRVNRDDIFARTGLNKETIANGIHALAVAGWILGRRRYKPGFRWYQLTILADSKNGKTSAIEGEFKLHWTGKASAIGQSKSTNKPKQRVKNHWTGKTSAMENANGRKNQCNGKALLDGKTRSNSLTESGGGNPPPPSPAGAGAGVSRTELLGVEENSDHTHLISVADTVRALTSGKSKHQVNGKAVASNA